MGVRIIVGENDDVPHDECEIGALFEEITKFANAAIGPALIQSYTVATCRSWDPKLFFHQNMLKQDNLHPKALGNIHSTPQLILLTNFALVAIWRVGHVFECHLHIFF